MCACVYILGGVRAFAPLQLFFTRKDGCRRYSVDVVVAAAVAVVVDDDVVVGVVGDDGDEGSGHPVGFRSWAAVVGIQCRSGPCLVRLWTG